MSEPDVSNGIAQDAGPIAASQAPERFSALFAAAPLGIALLDDAGAIVAANPALYALIGCAEGSLAGKDFASLTCGESDAEVLRIALEDLGTADGLRHQLHLVLEHQEEGPIRVRATVARLPTDDPATTHPVVMLRDVSELHDLRERLRHQNVHDVLTGLPNAASFLSRLESAMVDRSRARVALVFLDIDGFRIINDGLGAKTGDKVLQVVAGKLRSVFDTHEAMVARLTGDGFGVLLRGDFTAPEVVAQVERALEALHEPAYVDGHGVGVSASAGIVVRDSGRGSAEEMQRAAEITLHRAKEAGRAQWMLFDEDADRLDRERYRRGAVMASALENGEFQLVYQPTVKLDGSGQVPVVNALLRWNHPEAGVLRSEEFMPLADAVGMTLPLGRWMLSEALEARSRWRSAPGAPDLCVQLPARLAIDDNLVGIVRSALHRRDLPPHVLRLCADSAAVLDPRGEALDSLKVLGELGVRLVLAVSGAIDLEVIHRHALPVGFVVLTGRIIDALAGDGAQDPSTVGHIEHLIESAKRLGVRIGADGVRTEEQAKKLAELGVIAARGEYFYSALTSDEVHSLLAERVTDAS